MIKDIDLSLIELVVFDFDGVFTNNFVYVDEHGVEQVRCNRSDGLGLKKLKEINIKSCIVSTETNNVVQARAKKLGISCLNAIEDKGSAVKDLVMSLNIDLDRQCNLNLRFTQFIAMVDYKLLQNDKNKNSRWKVQLGQNNWVWCKLQS